MEAVRELDCVNLTDEQKALNAIRLGCTAGAPIVMVKNLSEMQNLDSIGATGIILAPELVDSQKYIENADRVIFHEYLPEETDEYLKRCKQYVDSYSSSIESGNSDVLGGPGMITIINDFEDLYSLFRFISELTVAQIDSLRGIIFQPLLLHVSNVHYLYEQEVLLRAVISNGLLGGLIFDNVFDIAEFKKYWGDKDLPHIVYQGNSQEIKKFFEDDGRCDGVISREYLTNEQADEIFDARIANIVRFVQEGVLKFGDSEKSVKEEFVEEEFTKKGSVKQPVVRIGILSLQGSYSLEKKMIESLRSYVHFRIKVIPIYTGEQLFTYMNKNYLTAIFCPGGWHGLQLKDYRHPDIGLLSSVDSDTGEIKEGAIDKFVDKVGHVYFSCASAIWARNSNKTSLGCSTEPAAGFMNYGINNNAVNGSSFVEVANNGSFKNGSSSVTGLFVGAPEFVRLGRSVGPVAILDNGMVVGVHQVNPDNGGQMRAMSLHTRRALLGWLNAVVFNEMNKLETSMED